MPFVISAQEAQAMQEDEVQLVMAVAQMSQRLPLVLHQLVNVAPVSSTPADGLRIFLGRRLVYGHLADGTSRRELDRNGAQIILEAIQKPVLAGVDRDAYRGKVPAIEIRDGESVLFREERDGTVTVNQIQLQISGADQTVLQEPPRTEVTTNGSSAPQLPESSPPDPTEVAQVASRLINPFNEAKPLYDEVSVGAYRIQQQGHHLSVHRENELILVVRDGEVVSHQLKDADRAAFLKLETQLSPVASLQANSQVAQTESPRDKPLATPLAVLEQETAQLPDSSTKTLLQATVNDWQRQGVVERATNWLTNQIASRRDQQLARTVLELFQRGYSRTGDRAYHVGNYTLSRQGQTQYTLKDARGVLMQFQTSNSLGLGRQVQAQDVSDRLSDFHRHTLQGLRQNRQLIPQSTLESEATYAAKTRQVEQTVRHFLQKHVQASSWSKEGGQFKLEIGKADAVRILDQWGRGVVYDHHQGEVSSRLTAQDFAYFSRLQKRMQQVEQKTVQASKPQLEIG
ncbi:MAG: hypothetical protein F6K00_29650 [Leptolyngbya sp. SIOISBB]|nr:hypothetical protein [Leptolyngbya sp. SIOISBB]